MKHTVIIEQGGSSYGAYVPDLSGCVAVGETKQEVLKLIKGAIEFHVEGLLEDGDIAPEPHYEFTHVEVNAA